MASYDRTIQVFSNVDSGPELPPADEDEEDQIDELGREVNMRWELRKTIELATNPEGLIFGPVEESQSLSPWLAFTAR